MFAGNFNHFNFISYMVELDYVTRGVLKLCCEFRIVYILKINKQRQFENLFQEVCQLKAHKF